jgi:hypothetical protein
MKNLCFFLLIAIGFNSYSQAILNEYKYVIVPKKFEGFRSENQYQTSTMVKYYLVKQGFNALYEDVLPQDLNSDRCLGLLTSLEEDSSIFATRISVVFKDCQGVERYRTQFGISKVKQFQEAYREAITEAFQSLVGFRYTYSPKVKDNAPVVLNFKDDVKVLPTSVNMPEENSISTETADTEIPLKEIDKEIAAPLSQPAEVMEAITLEEAVSEETQSAADEIRTLYAQKTETGYQLVDTEPSIQFYLWETSMPNIFMAERKGQAGLLYKRDAQWVFEYYEGDDRLQEVLQIKF